MFFHRSCQSFTGPSILFSVYVCGVEVLHEQRLIFIHDVFFLWMASASSRHDGWSHGTIFSGKEIGCSYKGGCPK